MTVDQYEAWIKSHQLQANNVNIADAVMGRITKQVSKPHIYKQAWETIPLDLIQFRIWMRVGVITCGVIMGFLRMLIQFYSVLFT